MSELAVRVEGLSKEYRLGRSRERYSTLRDQLNKLGSVPFWALFGRGERSEPSSPFWALKDVSFDVGPGEVIGIIGRNGAGKSTLLKIISRITEPTEGEVDIHGHVASLLEVGTGFHPELTGRENVYLNGAILGMGRSETMRKFDEIVAFAEVEKFIDTPVKHYSSGMYMRLAFAVAAHLEPEILIVDEVLAVGDAQFQRRCLGKMGEVAKGGRTVLFVSHNMAAVAELTTSVIILDSGRVLFRGPTAEGIAQYTAGVFGEQALGKSYRARPGQTGPHVSVARAECSEEFGEHICGQPITFNFDIWLPDRHDGICFSFQVCDESGRPICHFWLLDQSAALRGGTGLYVLRCRIPKFRLYLGRYTLATYLCDRRSGEQLENLKEICPFEVSMRGIVREEHGWVPGAMAYWEECEWATVTTRAAVTAEQTCHLEGVERCSDFSAP